MITHTQSTDADDDDLFIGIDIGGTKTAVAVQSATGHTVADWAVPTRRGPENVVDAVVSAYEDAAARFPRSRVRSIGVGVPGIVDTSAGLIEHSLNLSVSHLNLTEAVERRTGAITRVDNDVRAATLGALEYLSPDGEQPRSLAYINLGTGLAAGFAIDGRVIAGSRGGAGEIGHIPLPGVESVCHCGQYGCAERIASGAALQERWPSDGPAAPALFAAARLGQPSALREKEAFLHAVASVIRGVVLTFDPERVAIGGGLTALGDDLSAGISAVFTQWEQTSPFLRTLQLTNRVSLLPAGTSVTTRGAVLVGRSGLTEPPARRLPPTLGAAR